MWGPRVPAGPFAAGATVTIPVDSLSMTGLGDVVDTVVTASYTGVDLDLNRAVAIALPTQPFDTARHGHRLVHDARRACRHRVDRADGCLRDRRLAAGPVRRQSQRTALSRRLTVAVAFDQAGSVVATVTPTDATGTVTFSEGSTTLGMVDVEEGTATYDVIAKSLSVGQHTLTLDYSGDGLNKPSTDTVVVTITKSDSVVTAPAASWTVGTAGSIVATVTPTGATGTVTVLDGTTEVATGNLVTDPAATSATIAIPANALAAGSYTLNLAYSGDGTTKTATGTVAVTVNKVVSTVTGTASAITISQPGSVVATVTPTGATGIVSCTTVSTSSVKARWRRTRAPPATIPIAANELPLGEHEPDAEVPRRRQHRHRRGNGDRQRRHRDQHGDRHGCRRHFRPDRLRRGDGDAVFRRRNGRAR